MYKYSMPTLNSSTGIPQISNKKTNKNTNKMMGHTIINKNKIVNSNNENLTNTESVKSNSSNISIFNYSSNCKSKCERLIKYYYIPGLGCSKNTTEIYNNLFKNLFATTKDNMHLKIICKGYHKAIFTIAKRLVGKPPSNSDYLLKIQNNILNDLKIYNEVIVCGHSYGGSLISRIAKNLNKNGEKYNNLKMYTVGSIYIPQKELENINIIHFMNFSDISLRLSTTNYNKLKENFKEKLKNIILPFEFGEMKYFISNNKQIFYISTNSNITLKNRSISSISSEWSKHNEYYKIQYSILNSEKFRNELKNIKL